MPARPATLAGVDRSALLASVEHVARQAGQLILGIYGSEFTVRRKADASPVTDADEAAEHLIVAALDALGPWPVVAEEAASRGEAPAAADVFWLVDALDGTREFAARNGEFTVNIALIEHGVPVLGVVLVPVADRLYAGLNTVREGLREGLHGGGAGQGAWCVEGGQRQAIHCRAMPSVGATLACSRSHGDSAALAAWLQPLHIAARVVAGSSLKFGLLASGQADLYPRFGRTMEWDTAAGDAVLRAAGGRVENLDGTLLRYGKPGFENPHFIARGALSKP